MANEPVGASIPGRPEIWRETDTGKLYFVYYVPGIGPQATGQHAIPMLYEADEAAVQAYFGPGQPIVYTTEATSTEIGAAGALLFGHHSELANVGEDPFLAWEAAVTRQAAVRPWLLDTEVLGLLAEGLLENRTVSLAEFQQTQWWRTHSDAERAWLTLNVSDPVTAENTINDNRLAIRSQLVAAGVYDPSEDLVNYMADSYTQGRWTNSYLSTQVRAIADPHSGIEVDAGLATWVAGGIDTTRAGEDRVRELALEWLGPVYGELSDEDLTRWAGRLRNDPDGEDVLTDFLRRQRMAMFPTYENPNLTYENIATPWRNFVAQEWGQVADETDPLFARLVTNNDSTLNRQLLRQTGLSRGIGKVVNDLRASLEQDFATVRRPL